MGTFINYTNHPSCKWSEEQLSAALEYGEIVDVAFPMISAQMTESELSQIIEEETSRLMAFNPTAVLCQGEFTLTYGVVKRLQEDGVTVLAACSSRVVEECNDAPQGASKKITSFKFVRFREYTE